MFDVVVQRGEEEKEGGVEGGGRLKRFKR